MGKSLPLFADSYCACLSVASVPCTANSVDIQQLHTYTSSIVFAQISSQQSMCYASTFVL